MFKSIDYNLRFSLLLLILTALGIPILFYLYPIAWGIIAVLFLLFLIYRINKLYTRVSNNVVFLFHAIENNDYAFKFQENDGSMREREMHRAMNRIKDILAHTKREIIEQERFFGVAIENVSTGIIILDKNNQIQSVNHAAKQLLGLSIFTHLNQLQNIDPHLPQVFKDLEPNNEPSQFTIHTERGDFQLSMRADRVTMQRGSIKIIIINNIDVELDKKEIESWMRLIRVMTHEIMNSIAPITSLTDTLLFNIKANPHSEQNTEIITEGLETIHITAKELLNFVQSYRQFTRIPMPQPLKFDATELIRKAIRLTQENIAAKTTTIVFEEDEPYFITADRSHFMQVIINLLKNAIEATSSTPHGKITIAFQHNSPDYDILTVQNNGTPIPQEIISQLFIPFFTTKDQGSGIGLSISKYIMRMHGGTIALQSNQEKTSFSLYFPKRERE